MAKKIAFQFDDGLDYQLKAIQSVVELFRGLPRKADGIYRFDRTYEALKGTAVRNTDIVTGKRLLKNLNNIQLSNGLPADESVLEGNNFSIEMETGTGKTYVYLRTILELNREYGFNKFMIVVPSIAIRKGVWKSMEQLSDHLKRIYNLDILRHSFIYDSNRPKQISRMLVESNDLSICVLNIQAFNKANNKIRTEDEYGQNLWEDIKYIRPIVIIDEPQKIEGTTHKKSKSLEAIEELEPLFTLRYSATHKFLYNQLYKLDSYDAYQKNLVKKIEVRTVQSVIPKDYPYVRYVSFTDDLKARIELFSQKPGRPICFKTFEVNEGDSLEELSGGLGQYKGWRIAEVPHKLRTLKIEISGEMLALEMGKCNYATKHNETVRIQIRLAIENHFSKQMQMIRNGQRIKALTLFFIDSVDKVRDLHAADGRGEYLRIFDEEYKKYILKNEDLLEKNREFFAGYKNVLDVREGYFALDAKNNIVEVDGWNSDLDDDGIKINSKSQENIDRGIELILDKKDELISFEEPLSFIFSHSALREGWDNPNVFTLCTLKSSGSSIAKKQEIGRGLRLPVDIYGNRCLDEEINYLTVIANDYYDHFAAALQKDYNESMSSENRKKNHKQIEIRNGDNYSLIGSNDKDRAGTGASAKRHEPISNLSKKSSTISKDKFISSLAGKINKLLNDYEKNEYVLEYGLVSFSSSNRLLINSISDEAIKGDYLENTQKSDFEIINYIMYHTMLPRLAILKMLRLVERRELLNMQDVLDDVVQLIIKMND